MRVTSNFVYKNLVGTQVAQLATGMGTLHSVVVNGTSTSPVSLLDGTGGGTTAIIGTLKSSIVEATYLYDCVFGAGLRVNVQSNSDITVTWNQGS